VTKYNEIFFKKDLFFFRTVNDTEIAGSNWFITSEKENPVLKTTRDLLYEYWRKENYLCHYFIFHLLFNFAYNKYISDYLQMPNFSNIPVHYMQKQLTYRFNITLFTNILNEAYICFGTTKMLKDAGVLSGGFLKKAKLNMSQVNPSVFTKIDIRQQNSFKIAGKKPEILTQVPAGSYKITDNGDGTSTLTVTDTEKFWSMSNYLVVRY
jgi:hypothetical protein